MLDLITSNSRVNAVIVQVSLCNTLINAYAKAGELGLAQEVFDGMILRNSVNCLISGLRSNGALGVLGYGSPGRGHLVRYDSVVSNALISMHGQSLGSACDALRIFDEIKFRNLISWNSIISFFHKGDTWFGLSDLAKQLFLQLGIRNVVSTNGLMVGLGRGVHAYLVRNDLMKHRVSVGNALVNMHEKCGTISDATLVSTLTTEKDLISWNSLIEGFEDAVMSFRQMRRSGLMPANYTLISGLSLCSSLHWDFLGYQIHGEGIKLGLDLDCFQ
ncbi:hypothetical protein MLD38_040051 [Melastoma candidum]|nr:hypothetical protein MLD38_040051 [Melastoma candidum]